MKKTAILFASILLVLSALTGCSRTQKYTATGAAVGALTGAAVSGHGKGALIGAGIGAGTGFVAAKATER